MKKYIVLVVWPDGERYWNHWNTLSGATSSVESYMELGCAATVISTNDFYDIETFF